MSIANIWIFFTFKKGNSTLYKNIFYRKIYITALFFLNLFNIVDIQCTTNKY